MFVFIALWFLLQSWTVFGGSYWEVAQHCFHQNNTSAGARPIIPAEILSDRFHKVLLDWTPKASCTSAVVMFFDHMGLYRGVHYDGWPHEFRETAFYREYGLASLNMFEDTEWVRVKLVRNPFDRLVSSYIHSMKFEVVLNMDRTVLDTMTFADFVSYIESKTVDELYGLGSRHVGFQHRQYEYCFYLQNTAVYHIVKVEDADATLSPLNAVISGQPLHLTYKSDHYVARTMYSQGFVGNISWGLIKDNIPMLYRQFYDEDLKHRVQKLFHLDLVIYNYSFPETF